MLSQDLSLDPIVYDCVNVQVLKEVLSSPFYRVAATYSLLD